MDKKPVIYKETEQLEYAILSVIGNRENQEDYYGYKVDTTSGKSLFVICDGMGGQDCGERASQVAVEKLISEFKKGALNTDPANSFGVITSKANDEVCSLVDENGNRVNAGTTMVAVLVDGMDLYWSSVGDSRLYLKRGEDYVQITVDHNYKEYLIEKYSSGLMEREEYLREINGNRTEALLSFLGLNELQLVNRNVEPFRMVKDDLIVLMSDGLYKILSDDEIANILNTFKNPRDAVLMLDMKVNNVSKKQNRIRDNMTVAIIRIK